MTHNVTIFKNIKETQTPFFKDVGYILQRIKDGASKDLVKSIRNEKDKSKRNELKKNLPAICFSGRKNLLKISLFIPFLFLLQEMD